MVENSKSIVVTGATRGLGLAIAQQAIEAGYNVIGIGRNVTREFNLLNETQRTFIEFDLENIKKFPELVRDIIKQLEGAPYALVNNAAIGLDGLLATQHAREISKVLTLNLEAPITLSKYLVRHMIKKRRGRIVNISSIIAHTGFSGLSVYGATKAGLEGFTRSLAREVGRVGITVNCVAPGFMETDMSSSISGKKLDSIKRRAPLGLPHTENVAAAVMHLLEKKSDRTTGSIITVDGGSTA